MLRPGSVGQGLRAVSGSFQLLAVAFSSGGTRGLRRLMLLGLGLQFVRERQRPGQTLTLTVRLCAVPKPLVLGESVKHSSGFILL